MIILDTDVLTILQRGSGDEYSRIMSRWQASGRETDYVTIISYEEQTRGWFSVIARARSQAQQIEAYARLRVHLEDYRSRRILNYDEAASGIYQNLVKRKIRIGTMDLKIAAIALAHDALLISRNTADFEKVPGLRVEDWTVEPPT